MPSALTFAPPASVSLSSALRLLPPNFTFEVAQDGVVDLGDGLIQVQAKQVETLDVLLDFGTAPASWSGGGGGATAAKPAVQPAQGGGGVKKCTVCRFECKASALKCPRCGIAFSTGM